MPLNLLHNELILIFDRLGTGTLYELLVAVEHLYRRLKGRHAVMVNRVTINFEGATLLASVHGFAHSELVGWQQDSWHDVAAVLTRDFNEEACLLMQLQFVLMTVL